MLTNELVTSSDAKAFLKEQFRNQLEKSLEQQTPPNEPTHGDSDARAAFWTLLPRSEQRLFFLELLKNHKYFPRLRTLIGTPPYSFLAVEDEGLLRARGIARHRSNLVAPIAGSSYSDFKSSHFVDAAGRLYRIIETANGGVPHSDLHPGLKLVVDVRVKRCGLEEKRKLLDAGPLAAAAIVFPRVGDTLSLKLAEKLSTEFQSVRASVFAGRQKSINSPIARLGIKIV